MRVLAEVVGRFHWMCHAYCLMTNHYHLVVETPDANLSKGMRQLNGVFTGTSPLEICLKKRNDRRSLLDVHLDWLGCCFTSAMKSLTSPLNDRMRPLESCR